MSRHNSVLRATTGEFATIAIVTQGLFINFCTSLADLSTRFTWVKDLRILCSENLLITENTERVLFIIIAQSFHEQISKSPSTIFSLTVPRRYIFCGSFMFFLSCVCYLFNCALWSPAGKGLTFWLLFVVSNCEFVTFPLVSWVRCGTSLYRFLIFASLLTF